MGGPHVTTAIDVPWFRLFAVVAILLLAVGIPLCIFALMPGRPARHSVPAANLASAVTTPVLETAPAPTAAAKPNATDLGPAAETPAAETLALDSAVSAALTGEIAAVPEAEMVKAARRAAIGKVWIAQDVVLTTWPKYRDVREELRNELAATVDLDNSTADALREQAAALQAAFWEKDGTLSADGYRDIYKARVLLEIGHAREPANLAVSDDLVQAIMAAHPASTCRAGQRCELNEDVFDDLRALRLQGYEQTRTEVDYGRPFAWEDFARTADFAALFSDVDPPKATEAFEWALAQAGPNAMKPRIREYYNDVLRLIRDGGGVTNFEIYNWPHEDFFHECLYGRRWPSFRRPDPKMNAPSRMVRVAERRQNVALSTGGAGGN